MSASVVIHVFASPRRFARTRFSRCLVDWHRVTSSVLIVRTHTLEHGKIRLESVLQLLWG